jgi:methylated-DNA-protein-cysteine methyltransferase-like protein
METSRALEAIYAVVARIPRGRVSTYGRVADLAGLPRRARLVGRALRELPDGSALPWHRVLNAAGKVSARADALGHEDLQAHLLEREGVRLQGGGVPLDRYLWRPGAAARPDARGQAGRQRSGPATDRPGRVRRR